MDFLAKIFVGEMLGTLTLILLGNGIVANATFKKTLGAKGGLIAITFGWAMAVYAGVMVANIFGTGGHLNPAVTIGQAVGGKISAGQMFTYFGGELVGAALGQIFVTIIYWQHMKEETMQTVLGACATGPTHKKAYVNNVFSEFVGTAVLVTVAFFAINSDWFGGSPLAVALTVLAIGLSLGGTTGYAVNPARDLMPRIVHWVLYKTMGSKMNMNGSTKVISNWWYAWNPTLIPLLSGIAVGACFYITI